MASPLLGPGTFLDDRQQDVLRGAIVAEHEAILALPTDDPLDPKRRRRVDATLGEMTAQPAAVRATWARNAATLADVAARIARRGVERACLVGAGDSLAVMLAARLALEEMLGVPCEPVQSLEFAYYAAPLVTPGTLVVALSSSGETTRTVEAALVAQHRGAMTLAITNTPGSTLDRECEETLLVDATRVGWPTQSSTAALALLLRLAGEIGAFRSAPGARELLAELDEIPDAMARALELAGPFAEDLAAREVARRMYLFSGGGPNWASAVIGAANVKECTPDHALAIQVEEYHHYNSQKAGEPLVLLAPAGPSLPRARDTAAEGRRFGGSVYAVTSEGEDGLRDVADRVLHLPVVREALTPLLHVLPAQWVGYALAVAKFTAAEVGGDG
ncbi:MAG TPA: SIS domain-containing protein [Miltoncostaea sp.]|nr:SIS domain-containing protein [Miltoncostaea sp.]